VDLKLGTAYFGNRHLKHVRSDMQDIVAHGCNWVLHTFDEVDLKHNKERLIEMTQISQSAGLEVYLSPWYLGGIFGGECISAFAGRHPEARQVLSTGETVPYACPAHPAFRAFMKTWIEAACATGADHLFWDEPHLWIPGWEGRKAKPHEFSLGSLHAHAIFRKRYGIAPPKRRTAQVEEFRDWLIMDFLKWATKTARATRKGIKNTVCLLPQIRGPWPHPHWEDVAALPTVDMIATDPYWKQFPHATGSRDRMEGYVDVTAQRLAELGRRHKKDVQIWLQLFGLRAQDEGDISTAMRMFRQAGLTNIGGWGYEGCGAYASISSERPIRCWDRLGAEYKKARARKP